MVAEILKKIKAVAESRTLNNKPVRRAIITCPDTFTEVEKDRLKEAARLADLEATLLEEPVAAAIAYANAGYKSGQHILVYDLGGGTLNLALLAHDEGADPPFRTALPAGGHRVGGDDFDRAVYNFLERIVREKWSASLCPEADQLDPFCLRRCRELKEDCARARKSSVADAS